MYLMRVTLLDLDLSQSAGSTGGSRLLTRRIFSRSYRLMSRERQPRSNVMGLRIFTFRYWHVVAAPRAHGPSMELRPLLP